jgi:hypothetical protein
MANELKHASQGTELTQGEFEGVGLHVFDSQATGDIVYASSGSQLSRLAKGADNTVLQMSGTIPEWVQDVTFQGASGAAMNQYWFGDAGEDAADKWRVSVADGGALTYDSFISGSYATHMTVTPHATVTSSTVAFAGSISLGVDLAVAQGGTGASTLTANGVLIGNGTSAITSVAMGTKGQLLLGDGSGNPQMLTVGDDDQVLTADATETTGVKWADAGGGGVSVGQALAFSIIF